jgi:hypothetical protein
MESNAYVETYTCLICMRTCNMGCMIKCISVINKTDRLVHVLHACIDIVHCTPTYRHRVPHVSIIVIMLIVYLLHRLLLSCLLWIHTLIVHHMHLLIYAYRSCHHVPYRIVIFIAFLYHPALILLAVRDFL